MLKTVSSITNALGALNYKGTWNASTNSPALSSGAGTKGDYYVVSVAGSTTLDGISNWGVGDWATFNGSVWQRVEGGADLNGVNLSYTGTLTGGTGVMNLGSGQVFKDVAGNFYVGTTTNPGSRSLGFCANAGGGGIDIYQTPNVTDWAINAASGGVINFYSDNGAALVYAGAISVNGGVTTYATFSDHRLKENVQPMHGALEKVLQLKPVTFAFKNSGQTSQGFIAHELQAVIPDAVTGEKDAVDENGKPLYQGVDASFLIATLASAIQEQQSIIESLKARLDSINI